MRGRTKSALTFLVNVSGGEVERWNGMVYYKMNLNKNKFFTIFIFKFNFRECINLCCTIVVRRVCHQILQPTVLKRTHRHRQERKTAKRYIFFFFLN